MAKQRDYKVDATGISISNPNGEAPHRISWEVMLLAMDRLKHWSTQQGYGDLVGRFEEVAVVTEAAARRAGYDTMETQRDTAFF